jgi:hypothetical protein
MKFGTVTFSISLTRRLITSQSLFRAGKKISCYEVPTFVPGKLDGTGIRKVTIKQKNSVVSVLERPLLVNKASANFCG